MLAMLFHVRMDVHIPYGADSTHVDKLRSDEKARAQHPEQEDEEHEVDGDQPHAQQERRGRKE